MLEGRTKIRKDFAIFGGSRVQRCLLWILWLMSNVLERKSEEYDGGG